MKAQSNFKILSHRRDSDSSRGVPPKNEDNRRQQMQSLRDNERDRITFNNFLRQDNSLSASISGGERSAMSTIGKNQVFDPYDNRRDTSNSTLTNIGERLPQASKNIVYQRQSRPITSQDFSSNQQMKLGANEMRERYNQTQVPQVSNMRDTYSSVEKDKSLKDNILELKARHLLSSDLSPGGSNYSHNRYQEQTNVQERLISPTVQRSGVSQFNFQNQASIHQQQQDDGSNDLEQQLLGLQSKIQNLEGKYIDLANFYKQGALKSKLQPPSSSSDASRRSTAENFYQNRGQSPLRAPEFDQAQEKQIINQLIKEKSDLESELQNIINIQSTLMQQDKRINDKIDTLEREYQSIQNHKNANPSVNADAIIRRVESFEKELMFFINENYNSFTENDISNLFGVLKNDLNQKLQNGFETNVYSNQFGQSNEDLMKALNEFEINQEYNQQDIKRLVFEAQSKHDLMLLDLKKSQMILSSLVKSTNELDQLTLKSRPPQYSTSPNRKAFSSEDFIHEIQVNAKQLQQTFQQLQSKVMSSGDDLKSLMQFPENQTRNLDELKKAMLTNGLCQDYKGQEKILEIMEQELQELREANGQLQQDLKFASEKMSMTVEENVQLRDEIEALNKKREHSPISLLRRGLAEQQTYGNSRQSQERQWSIPDKSIRQEQNQEIQLLQAKNISLERKLQTLTRSLEEKDQQIDKLGRDLNKASKLTTLQTLSQNRFQNEPSLNVTLDQLHFYQSFADQQLLKLKNLIRQTQKFLYAMKKLQKAVHKKQPNVSKEKGDFEVTRKELEYMLKDLKKEVDENILAQQNKNHPSRIEVQGFRDPYQQSHGHQQNTTLHESIEQNYRSLSNMGSHSKYKRQDQINTTQNTLIPPESANQTILASHSYFTRREDAHSREISPIMLRQKPQYRRNEGREQFRSIEPDIRRNGNTLLSTLSVDRQHRSPSVDAHPQDRLGRYQSPSAIVERDHNRHQDIDLLLQQINDLKKEREMQAMRLGRLERDKDSIYLDKQQVEIELEKMRRQIDVQKQDYLYLQEQKEQLSQELQKIIDGLHGDVSNDQKIQELQKQMENEIERSEKLAQQLQVAERLSFEQRRTISILEESAESAKKAYNDQKDMLEDREQTISELREKLDQIRRLKGNRPQDPASLENLKQQLMDDIKKVEKEQQAELEQIKQKLEEKESEISKAKRQLSRVAKEQEIKQQTSEFTKEPKQEEIRLNERIKGLEFDLASLNSELEAKDHKLKALQKTHETALNDLNLQHESLLLKEREAMGNQISKIDEKNKYEIDKMSLDHQTQLAKLDRDHQRQLKKLTNEHDTQIQNLEQSLALKFKANKEDELQTVKAEYDNKIASQQVQHERDMKKLKDSYEAQMKQLQESSTMSKDHEIESLRQRLKEEENLRKTEKALFDKRIKEQLDQKDSQIKELQAQLQSELDEVVQQNQINEEQWQVSLEQKDQQIRQLSEKIKTLQTETKKQLDSLQSSLKDANQEQSKQIEALNQDKAKLSEQLELASQQHKGLMKAQQKELDHLQQSLKDVKLQHSQQIEDKEQKLAEQLSLIKQLEEQISMTRTNLTSQEEILQNQIDYLQEQIKTKDQSLKDVSQNLSLLNAKINGKEKKITELENKNQEIEKSYRKANKEVQELLSARRKSDSARNSEIKTLESQVATLKQEKQELTEEIEKVKAGHSELQQEKETFCKQIEALNLQLTNAKEESNQRLVWVQNSEKELEEMRQTMKDLENESAYAKSIKNSMSEKLEKMINERQDKDQKLSYEVESLNAQLNTLRNQLLSKDAVISELEEQILTLKEQEKQSQEQFFNQKKAFDHQLNEIQQKSSQIQQELLNAQNELKEITKSKDQQIKELVDEKQQAQDQLRQMVSHQSYEKQSQEERLQQQLSQALDSLQLKEQELLDLKQSYELAQVKLRESERAEQEYQTRLQQLEEENEQYQQEISENEEERNKHQQALENNRSLIQMLKTELQKAIDKQKQVENAASEGKDSREAELNQKIQTLEGQIQNLRQDFEDKQMEQKLQIDTLESEIQLKNQLIEEANVYVEEFNDEKHVIKAKFKHLMQVLDSVMDESSYKEDDEVDLEECFERFEKEFLKNKQRVEEKIESLERDNSILRQETEMSKEELNQLQIKMAGLQADLMNAINKQESNDIEMRKKLENASKKVQQYKDKVVEKQQVIMELEAKLKELVDFQQAISERQDSNRSQIQKEKVELQEKLHKTESELLSLKQLQSSLAQGIQDKVTAERIDQLESQLMNLRKQIFFAKDQVIDALSETFAKRIKDLQNAFNNDNVLRARLSEMKSDTQIQALNNNIKMIKYLTFSNKRLLIVQVLSNSECYVIDESKLTDSCQTYLRQFLPSTDTENDETFIHIDEKQQRLLDDLILQMKGLADQRNKFQKELNDIKQKLGKKFEQQSSELHSLHLEDELEQTQIKLKEVEVRLQEQLKLNLSQRSRIIELNEIIRELTQSADADSANRKVIKLMEDNESLRQQLMSAHKKERQVSRSARQVTGHNEEEDEVEEGAFMQGIQVADNVNRSHQSQDDVNLFDQSSIYGVIEGLNEGEEHLKTQQDMRIKKLEQQLQELESRNKTLQTEVQRSQQQSLNPVEQGILDNIKGTLIQFLKNCPYTEKNNEVLLEIIFSMMDFAEDEKQAVQEKRKRFRSASARSNTGTEPEEEVKKATKKGIFGMFRKKDKAGDSSNSSSTRKPEELISPIRPIRRM